MTVVKRQAMVVNLLAWCHRMTIANIECMHTYLYSAIMLCRATLQRLILLVYFLAILNICDSIKEGLSPAY